MRGLFIPERITSGNGNAWTQHDNVFNHRLCDFYANVVYSPHLR